MQNRQTPPMAPEQVVRAALQVLHVAGYTTRNWTRSGDAEQRRIFDLWEALHPVPQTLLWWVNDAEQRLLLFFDEYDEKWPEPRLRAIYEAALRQASK
jgi:hypothetical protein